MFRMLREVERVLRALRGVLRVVGALGVLVRMLENQVSGGVVWEGFLVMRGVKQQGRGRIRVMMIWIWTTG